MNINAFYRALSEILGEKYGVKITAEVIENGTISTSTTGVKRHIDI